MSLLDGLLSYWKLNAASVVADAHGSNTLTNNNSVTTAAGKLNEAAVFVAASSQSLSHASNADFAFGNTDFAFSCWVKSSDPTSIAVFTRVNSGFTTSYGLTFISGAPNFFIEDSSFAGAAATWGSAISADTWCHIICWHDSVNDLVGISINNGTPVTTSVATGSDPGDGPFVMAEYFGGYHSLLVDELAMYAKVLSADERTALYGAGTPPAYETFGSLPGSGGNRRRRSLICGRAA